MSSYKFIKLYIEWLLRPFKNPFMLLFIGLLLSFFTLDTLVISICPQNETYRHTMASQHLSVLNRPINCMDLDDPLAICNKTACWNSLETDTMSGTQFIHYLLWTNQSSCTLTYDFGGFMLETYHGSPPGYDGQRTVCMDQKVRLDWTQCLVYSFGIHTDWTFDEQMELFGCKVFSFDPSINMKPHNHTLGVHFFDWGLSHINGNGTGNQQGWQLRTLSSIYDDLSKYHGQKTIDYLKIDIEFNEWKVIPEIVKSGMLSKVRQLSVEFHVDWNESIEEYRKKAKIIRSLENLGMVRFNSLYNMWTVCDFIQLKIRAACAYEISWYNSKLQRNQYIDKTGYLDLLNVYS